MRGFHDERTVTSQEAEHARDVLQRWVETQENAVEKQHQTIKQPVVWCCLNPECRLPNGDDFQFEQDEPKCPKCTYTLPVVYKRSLIHMLIHDVKGPIVGYMGLRYRIPCDPKRAYLATATNGEGATGDLEAANCPGCLKELGAYVRSVKGQGFYLKISKKGDR